jgi:hypothetical protein
MVLAEVEKSKIAKVLSPAIWAIKVVVKKTKEKERSVRFTLKLLMIFVTF